MHPRDKQENLALIARAERLYEERLHDREHILAMIIQFQASLETQDEKLVARDRLKFAAAMDNVDRN